MRRVAYVYLSAAASFLVMLTVGCHRSVLCQNRFLLVSLFMHTYTCDVSLPGPPCLGDACELVCNCTWT